MQYEDIIRSIRVHLDEVTGCGGCKYTKGIPDATCFLNMIEDAANALETSEKNRMYLFDRVCELEEDNSELKELVPKWISVKDEPPNDSRTVIIYSRSGIVGCGFYMGSRNNWIQLTTTSGGVLADDVTHWMELPQSPKGVYPEWRTMCFNRRYNDDV